MMRLAHHGSHRLTRIALLGLAALAAMLLAASSGSPGFATPPPPPQVYVIIEGDFVGVPLAFDFSDQVAVKTVPLERNPELKIEGVIEREPGDAQAAYFTGKIGDAKVVRAPALDLYDQESLAPYLANPVRGLLEAEQAPLRKVRGHLRGPLRALQIAERAALREPKVASDELLNALYRAQIRIYEARDFYDRLPRHPKTIQKAKLQTRLQAARRAAQEAFAAVVEQGLDLGYDVRIAADASYPDLEWNTLTGQFSGASCGNTSVYGIGAVEATPRGYRLTALTDDFSLEASIDTSTHSGMSTIRTLAGDTCTIIDSDTTR